MNDSVKESIASVWLSPLTRTSVGLSLVLGSLIAAGCGGGSEGDDPSGMVADDASDDEGTDTTSDDTAADDAPASDDEADDEADDPDDTPGEPDGTDTGPAATEADVEGLLSNTIDSLSETANRIEADDSTASSDSMSNLIDGLSGCGTVDPIQIDVAAIAQALSDALQTVSDTLKEDVFREDLVESDDGTTVVYWLDPDKLCDADSEDFENCHAELSDTKVRVSVTDQPGDTLLVELIIDDDERPMSMVLSDSGMEVTADLQEVLDVLVRVAGDDVTLPDMLSGVLRASLVKKSDDEFELSYGLPEALNISMPVGDEGKSIVGSIAASDDALSMTLNGQTNSISYAVNWNQLDVSVPGSVVCEELGNCGDEEQQGNFNLHLGGYSYATVLQDGLTEIVIDDFGFGNDTSSLRLNDEPLVELDLNPQDGRRLSIQIQDTPEGTLVSFEPKLDLRIATTLSNLSDSLSMDLPSWLEDEIFRVTFGGEARAQLLVPDSCAEGDERIKITEGTLTLAASSAESVIAEAGMCLDQAETVEGEEQSHPLQMIAAVACE